jgi:hypothetical protein
MRKRKVKKITCATCGKVFDVRGYTGHVRKHVADKPKVITEAESNEVVSGHKTYNNIVDFADEILKLIRALPHAFDSDSINEQIALEVEKQNMDTAQYLVRLKHLIRFVMGAK